MTEMNGNIQTEVIDAIDEPMELTTEDGKKVILVKVATKAAQVAVPAAGGWFARKFYDDSKEKSKKDRATLKAERKAAKEAKKAAKAERPKMHVVFQSPIHVYKDTPKETEVQPENSEKNSDN